MPNAYLVESAKVYSGQLTPVKKLEVGTDVLVDFDQMRERNGVTLVQAQLSGIKGWLPLKSVTRRLEAMTIQRKSILLRRKAILKDAKGVNDFFSGRVIRNALEHLEYYIYDEYMRDGQQCYLLGKRSHLNKITYKSNDFLGWVAQDELIFWNTNVGGFDKRHKLYIKILNNDNFEWHTQNRHGRWEKVTVDDVPKLDEKIRGHRDDVERTVVWLNDLIRFLKSGGFALRNSAMNFLSKECRADEPLRKCIRRPLVLPIDLTLLELPVGQITPESAHKYICEAVTLRDKLRLILSGRNFFVIKSFGDTQCPFHIQAMSPLKYFDKQNYMWIERKLLRGENNDRP